MNGRTGFSQSRAVIALLVGMCCAAPSILHASAPPSHQQQTVFSPSPLGAGLSGMVVQSSGVVYILGGTDEGRPFISRVEPNGAVAWIALDAPIKAPANNGPLAVDPAGNAYLALNDFSGPAQQGVIVKYSPSGARLGEARPTSPNPGSPIASNGVALDPSRGTLYVSMEFLNTDGKFAILVVQYDLSLVELRRDIYTGPVPSGILGTRGFGGIFTSTAGNVTLAGFDMPPSNVIQLVLLRYGPDLAGGVVEHPGQRNPQSAQSDPFGGMHLFAQEPTGAFVYRKVAPELGPARPNPGFGAFAGVGPDEEAYFARGFPSRQVQRFDAGVAAWTPPLATDANKAAASFARVSSPTANLYLVGTFSGGVYLDRYGAAQQQGFLSISSGNNQVGIVGQPLPIPLEVAARDASSAPVSGVVVNFTISSVPANAQGQALSVPSQTTGPDGKASTVFTLGSIPLEYEVQATASASTVTFQACGKLANEGYHQDQAPWDDDVLDHHRQGKTISKRGCALTAMTMLINAYQRRYGLGYATSDPGALNAYLTDPAHYGFRGNANLDWRKALRNYTGGVITYLDPILVDQDVSRYEASVRTALAKVDASLLRGEPAILHLQSTTNAGHFVLAVGRCGGNYLVADPNSATDLKTLDPLARRIRGMRLFELKTR